VLYFVLLSSDSSSLYIFMCTTRTRTYTNINPLFFTSQLTKKEVKQIADIFLKDVFKRADEKGIKIEVTEKFKDRCVGSLYRCCFVSIKVWS
jgi:tRNA U34 2-thiouridine synthase MnmA/TrmU